MKKMLLLFIFVLVSFQTLDANEPKNIVGMNISYEPMYKTGISIFFNIFKD